VARGHDDTRVLAGAFSGREVSDGAGPARSWPRRHIRNREDGVELVQGIGSHIRAVDVEFQIVEPLDDVVEPASAART
jgi:hypothetical protein